MRGLAKYCLAGLLSLDACLVTVCCTDNSGIECSTRADCPEGYFCDLTRNRCDILLPDGGDATDGNDGGDESDEGVNIEDGDAGDGGELVCQEPRPFEEYCIRPDYPCLDVRHSYCSKGEWKCFEGRIHPPPQPDFDDWAWRCEVYRCNARIIPDGPGADWQDESPYVPPDPETLTGEWELVANDNDVVPIGCEKQPRQYAVGYCLVVNPLNPNVMYVGFALPYTYHSYDISGVFKSVDGGESWFEARGRMGSEGCYEYDCSGSPSVYRLYMDPDDPEVVFASTEGWGLYRTADGARTWQFVDLPYQCGYMGPVGKGPDGVYHAACGIPFRSRDGGVSWEQMPGFSEAGRWITAFGFDKRYPARVWAGMCEGSIQVPGEGYMFLSDDDGESWTEMGQDIDDDCQGRGAVRSIAICDADPYQMAAAVYQCGLFLSEDGGISWHRASNPVDGWFSLSVKYAPLDDRCRLYAGEGDSDATWWTEDGGRTWTRELYMVLDDLFFNPFVPDIITGIVVQDSYGHHSTFELWTKK